MQSMNECLSILMTPVLDRCEALVLGANWEDFDKSLQSNSGIMGQLDSVLISRNENYNIVCLDWWIENQNLFL